MNMSSTINASGTLGIKVIRAKRPPFLWRLSNILRPNYIIGWLGYHVFAPLANKFGIMTARGTLSAVKISLRDEDRREYELKLGKALALQDESESEQALKDLERWVWMRGDKTDYGVLGYRSITTAFVNFVTDQLQTETSVFGDFKYHDSGVGTTAENITDTAMETTDGESRATGTQTESAANAYRSVGTISYTTTKAITEHGLFNDVSAGTLMDRTVFSAVNVVNGDSIQFTYTVTWSAGG